jgi:hypothetical protein
MKHFPAPRMAALVLGALLVAAPASHVQETAFSESRAVASDAVFLYPASN